jgi:hypothetical protein
VQTIRDLFEVVFSMKKKEFEKADLNSSGSLLVRVLLRLHVMSNNYSRFLRVLYSQILTISLSKVIGFRDDSPKNPLIHQKV